MRGRGSECSCGQPNPSAQRFVTRGGFGVTRSAISSRYLNGSGICSPRSEPSSPACCDHCKGHGSERYRNPASRRNTRAFGTFGDGK